MSHSDPVSNIHPVLLAPTASSLRAGRGDLIRCVNEVCDRIEAIEPKLQSLLPESGQRARLLSEASALQSRYPEPATRPALYGILVGVKDIFRVDGFETRCGSTLPAELFAGPEEECVTALRRAGVLILGKTVTTEFAYMEPGPTRNPHNLEHTPGGSSSGSAAAVAAGFCQVALGTQTVGSTIRPAAFCGIVGFKPSFGRIETPGVIPFSESADHVGLFTQDIETMRAVAAVQCRHWNVAETVRFPSRDGSLTASAPERLPILGVPDGPYMAQALPEGLAALESQITLLKQAGYSVRRVAAFENIADIKRRHMRMIAAELAQVHREWFEQYESFYRPRTAALIREGQTVNGDELSMGRVSCLALRAEIERLMTGNEIDLWICPPATGTAPRGLAWTGDAAMNLPWTHAGMPAITVPAGRAENGLPMGLQCVASFGNDERLLAWAPLLARTVRAA